MTKVWNPRLGLGDLDYRPTDCTFKPERGEAIHFQWTCAKTGKPGKMPPRRTKAQREAMKEWDEWLTFTTREGEVLTFRRNGPPPESEVAGG